MTQLNLTPIQNTDTATADLFNQRLAAIAKILNKGIDADNIKDGAITATLLANDMLNKQYPIGTIYWNGAVDTNPSILLGFGTWSPYAVGNTVVGFDSTQTEFNAVGKTGGAKKVSLTAAQNGEHNHGINDPGHAHSFPRDVVVTSAGGSQRTYLGGGSGQQLAWSAMGGSNPAGTGISTQNSGNGEAHENMPPYTVAYGWIRTL